MTIRPVHFNGMIQNTPEASFAKANEDNKGILQQNNIQNAVVKEEQQASSTVRDMEETNRHDYNYREDGKNGAGGGGKKRKKKPNQKEQGNQKDGSVVRKDAYPSFDMKI